MNLTDSTKAYMAGIIDGEGSIIISKRPPNKKRGEINVAYSNCMHISNNDGRLISWIVENFSSGSVCCDPPRRNSKHHYRWTCASLESEKILRTVYDFLIIKKEQAEIIFKFRETFKGFSHSKGLPEEILEKRKYYHAELKRLHRNAPI